MTARDLTQTRATDGDGNTVWRAAPLIQAALNGRLAVLDGLHRLHTNTLATLSRYSCTPLPPPSLLMSITPPAFLTLP